MACGREGAIAVWTSSPRSARPFGRVLCVVCAFALMLQGVAFAVTPDVTAVSSTSHPVQTTWYDADSAEIAWTGGLPLTVGVVSTATALDSAVAGGYLYAAMGSEGVAVYDVRDPAAPVLVGQDDGSVAFARDVAVCGQTLIVLTQSGTGGLVALDISDPAAPAYLASATVPNGGGSDLELVGDVLYVTQANGLSSFCVRDPGSPMLMGSSASTGVTVDGTVSGRTAFAATGSAFLYAWDVSVPGAIGSYATISTGSNTSNVAAAGPVLYVSVSNAIQVWDVSDPAAPSMVDSYATTWDPGALVVIGTQLVCRAHGGGIHVLDASDPAALGEVATAECGPGWEHITVDGGCVYAGTPDGFDVVCAATLDEPAAVDAVAMPGLLGIATWDRYAYPFHWRIGAYDMSDPTAPVALSEYLAIGSVVYDVDVCDGLVAVADSSGITQILRVGDDGTLSLASAVAFGGPAMLEVEFEGRTAIFFQQSTGYRLIDVTNPALPAVLSTIPDVSTDGGMTRHGDVLLTASTSGGIRAFDVGNVTSPVLLGSLDAPLAENDVAASGSVAVVTGSSPARMVVLDISDPTALTIAAMVDLTDHPSWVELRGTTAYVSTQAELIAFDITEPTAPVELWRLTQGADGLRECALLGDDHLVTLWEGIGMRTFDTMFTPAGYSVTVDQSAETTPDAMPDTAETSMTVPALPDGVNYVHVSAVDDVARVGTPVHRALRVDTNAPADPALSSTTPTGTPQPDNTISVALAGATDGVGSGVAGYSVRWNEGSEAQADTVMDYAFGVGSVPSGTVSDGSWYCDVRTVDAMGHWTAGTTIGPFVVDTTNPTAPSVGSSTHPVTSTWYAADDVTLAWSSSDANGIAGYSWVWDEASGTVPDLTSEGASETVTFTDVADGVRYFHVRAKDAAGNWGSTTHRAVRIDTTPPLTTSNAQATYTGSASILLTPSDVHSGVAATYYRLDGSAETSATSVACSTYGEHTLTYWSVDGVGNVEPTHTETFSVVSGSTTYLEVAGSNRYQTALDACRHAFTTAPAVVLATGENWPDALGGAALAGAAAGPILLTEPGRLTAGVFDQIRALGATRVYLLGGTAAISAAVEDGLESALGPGDQVTRLGGSNRFGTARLVAAEAARLQGAGYDGTVFVATGTNFPDALAASPVSAAKGWPILLCDAGGLDASSYALLSAIGAEEAYLLGGSKVVPTTVQQRLVTLLGSSKVHRLEGSDRYSTGVAIARQGVAEGLTWDHLAIGTGQNFPDALAGGVMQGKLGSVVLLTETDRLPAAVRAELVARADLIGEVCYLGGTGAVSETVRAAVRAALH